MVWLTMGTVQPNITDWQIIGSPLIYGVGADVSLFRVTHDWNANLWPSGSVWMAGWFPGNHLAVFDKLYPYKGASRLIHSPLPVAYQQAGYLERSLAFKADDRTRIYADSNWTITVEYFQPEVEEPTIPELLDLADVEQSIDLLETELEDLTNTYFPEGTP